MSSVDDDYKTIAAKLLRDPNDPVALLEQFCLLLKNGKEENRGMWACLAKRAHDCAHEDINTIANLGSGLALAGRHYEAISAYLRALQFAQDDEWRVQIYDNLGIAYRAMGQNETAIRHFKAALALAPNNAAIKQDMALATLAAGRLNEGLRLHEVRREISEAKRAAGKGNEVNQGTLPPGVVHWQGEPLLGKTITVYHEEGIGDFFMWSRFLPRLKDAGATYVCLTGKNRDVLEFVAGQSDDIDPVDDVYPLKGPIPTDYVVGSLTFPWRCGVEYSDVRGAPYFKASPAKIPRRSAVNVGLVWRGSTIFPRDWQRSMSLRDFVPLFDMPQIAFNSLQLGDGAKEVDQLGFSGFVGDLSPFMKTWAQTASVIQALDVVVTVDTAITHLAGALGKPVLMLAIYTSDWRWPRDSERAVWYDSMTVLRQERPGDWSRPLARVRELLEERRGELKVAA